MKRFHFVLCFLVPILFNCSDPSKGLNTDYPQVLDSHLELALILEDPEIVTPIGLTIDSKDHLYVLESHTHSPPKDYAGPGFDRILKGVDQDQDGVPEEWIVFADSIESGLNLLAGPDDVIYLVEKDKVKSFVDINQDGVSDQMQVLWEMHTSGTVYDHAGLLGITYADGWLYISRGNTGGLAWSIEGPDGSKVEGYGDGGNVIRCRLDGSSLEEVATGFWNPFDLKFTKAGKLLLADNDPDSRGPNRLIDVVPGGHYGYESLYGNSGNHPYLAWNGELPGTLPYAAALGEAPSGIVDASYSHFPNYQNNMLVTIWEENSLVRVPLKPHHSSVRGKPEVIVQGDSSFHPVALAVNSQGDIYLTDWVVRQYPNHGKGKIWRLTAKESNSAEIQESSFENNTGLSSLYASIGRKGFEEYKKALSSEDPFAKAVARQALSAPKYHKQLLTLSRDQNAEIRLQALLALSASEEEIDKALLQQFLQDENEQIRKMTLIYIGKNLRADMLEEVLESLTNGRITPAMIPFYLATVRHLQPEFIDSYQSKAAKTAKNLQRELPEGFLVSVIQNEKLSDEIRAAVLPYLEDEVKHKNLLLSLLSEASRPLQEAVLQALRTTPDKDAAQAMAKLASNPQADEELRAIALVSLGYQTGNYCQDVLPLLNEDHPNLLFTAFRYLSSRCGGDEQVKKALENRRNDTKATSPELASLWQFYQGNTQQNRPASYDAWQNVVDDSGDASRGKLIFQMASTRCQQCHQVDGWGGEFGPDLSHVGSSKNREQLISAIIAPSQEISPEWQGWYVTDQQGQKHLGRQIDVGTDEVELIISTGEFKSFKHPQSYGTVSTSLMPEGLEESMTTEEFNHLIAYLASLK